MRINITTDSGEVLMIIPPEEIGDLSKTMACTDLMLQIQRAQKADEGLKKRSHERKRATRNS